MHGTLNIDPDVLRQSTMLQMLFQAEQVASLMHSLCLRLNRLRNCERSASTIDRVLNVLRLRYAR